VRQYTGDNNDGLPFQQNTGQERRITVNGDERFESHATSYHKIGCNDSMARQAENILSIGAGFIDEHRG
jgi:hypothetical protein